jgi:flagellar hook-basal body protein
MYAAVTGLSALGTGMQTISNNIANVNTVGFKAMRTNYEDLISQNYFSGGKTSQKGTGVRISTIQSMFTQGAFMSSAQDTDMAIAGEGFFSVRNKITGGINYTRAGVFTLNKDGYMEDPNGNILQGWKLALPKPGQPAVKIGAPTDIKITVVNAPPAATSEIKIVTNLDADAEPAYEYKEHQLTFDYADEIARLQAEIARAAAEWDVWNEYCSGIQFTPLTSTGFFNMEEAYTPDPPAYLSARTFYASNVVTAPGDTDHPAVRVPAAGELKPDGTAWAAGDNYSAKVWFSKQIFFPDPNGFPHSATIYTSADIAFRVRNTTGANPGPYWVSAGTFGINALCPNAGNPNKPPILAPLPLPTIEYTYSTQKVAMMEHITAEGGYGDFTTRLGVVVPAGVPGDIYTTEVSLRPNPPITFQDPAGNWHVLDIERTIPVNFVQSSYTYICAMVTSSIAIGNIQYPYTSSLNGSTVTMNVGRLVSPSNLLTSAGHGLPVLLTSAGGGEISALIWFSVPFTETDANGITHTSAILTSSRLFFSSAAHGVTLTSANISQYLLGGTTTSGQITSYTVETTPGNTSTRPCPVNFSTFSVSQPFTFTYGPGDFTNKIGTWPYPPGTTSAVNFQYVKAINIPAANPGGHPPTFSGDIYYEKVFFYPKVTPNDPYYTGPPIGIMVSANVGFIMTNSPQTSGLNGISVSGLSYTVRYPVNSPDHIGGSLDTAIYSSAKVDFTTGPSAIYDRNFLETYLSNAIGSYNSSAVTEFMNLVRTDPVQALKWLVVVDDTGPDWPPVPADRIIPSGLSNPGNDIPPYYFRIGRGEVGSYNLIAWDKTEMDAKKAGETRFSTVYNDTFKAYSGIVESFLPEWKLEGMGFAAAWDARDLDGDGEYIDTTGIHVEPIVIYDSLGSQHQLMIYYQKNPHMENVWDYIITCDPLEDARKDNNNIMLLTQQASFSGLVQKGKITFTGDGPDRHGGVIKDIEAQNLHFVKPGDPESDGCMMSSIDPAANVDRKNMDRSYTWQNATIGGYYTGSPRIDPLTGNYMSDDRTYEVLWGGVNEGKLEKADNQWLEAFKVYMEYLDGLTPPDADLAYYKTISTKVQPEDKVDPTIANSPTWQQRFEEDWKDGGIFVASAAVVDKIRKLLPYANNGNSTYGPTGAARPSVYDRDVSTKGSALLYWGGNINDKPPTSGFTVIDTSTGKRTTVPVTDKNAAGPYNFGSGLTITFSKKDVPLKFGRSGQDGFQVTAHSEQIVWENLTPNTQGVFDFDLAFVTSASMALHPPYPEGLPTIEQHVAFDMGARNPNGLSAQWKVDRDLSTTQYAATNATLFKGQDGHAAGSLQRVSIGEDGVVTGIFTNGFQLELYQIGLIRFINPWGLYKMGDNLFAETRYSGTGAMNEPGNAGTGTILANFLEQSTVDVAEEIVNMILTQRGFQANSKTVTTTDTMLNEVIEMKR